MFMDLFLHAFLKDKTPDLRRIARNTHGDMTVDELKNEVWLVAKDIERKRGYPVNFTSSDDHQVVLSWMYMEFVTKRHSVNRYAVHLDQEHDIGDGDAVRLLDRLAADDAANPLMRLILLEDAVDAEELLAASYSQAAAYVAVFYCFRYDREKICAYLVVSDGALMARVRFAIRTVRMQSSLFDGVETIDESFMPMRGRQYALRIEPCHTVEQACWDF